MTGACHLSLIERVIPVSDLDCCKHKEEKCAICKSSLFSPRPPKEFHDMIESKSPIYNGEPKGLSKYLDDAANTTAPQPPDALLPDLADIQAEMEGDIQALISESKKPHPESCQLQ